MGDSNNGNGNGPTVNYTTKELIARVESKVDTVLEQLQLKAGKDDLTFIERRVANIEAQGSPHVIKLQAEVNAVANRIANLETDKAINNVSKSNRRWIIGLVGGSAVGWITMLLKIFGVI